MFWTTCPFQLVTEDMVRVPRMKWLVLRLCRVLDPSMMKLSTVSPVESLKGLSWVA